MANVEHVDILNAECHEPKHITDGTGGDTGKVITNHSSAAGTSVYRLLKESEIEEVIDYYTVGMSTIATAQSAWVVAIAAGTIVSFSSVIDGALTTVDETITLEIGGTPVTNGVITIAYSGSAAGDVDAVSPTSGNTVGANGAIEVVSSGASSGTVNATFTIGVKRSSP